MIQVNYCYSAGPRFGLQRWRWSITTLAFGKRRHVVAFDKTQVNVRRRCRIHEHAELISRSNAISTRNNLVRRLPFVLKLRADLADVKEEIEKRAEAHRRRRSLRHPGWPSKVMARWSWRASRQLAREARVSQLSSRLVSSWRERRD